MKFLYLLCFLSIFHIIHPLDLGGIKFAINEKMAGDLLYHFYPTIMTKYKKYHLPNIGLERGVNLRELYFYLTEFDLNKCNFKFTEKGININIEGIKAYIVGVAHINKILEKDRDVRADINEFGLNANLIVHSKKDEKNKLVPYAEFTETPKLTLDFEIDIENTLWLVDEALESSLEKNLKESIYNNLDQYCNMILKAGLDLAKNYTVMPIDEPKGLYIDYSLVDIKMRKGFLEINSYAFLFNKNKPETMKPKRIPFTILPPITSIDNPNQLFISEYSLNSALYTYFITYPLSLKINIDSKTLESLLPTIGKEIADKTEVFFETTEPPTLSLKLSYIKGEIFGKVTIKVKGRDDLTIVCSLQLSPKLELIIKDDINLTGKIYELDIKINKIEVGESHATFLIQYADKLSPLLIASLNDYISQNLKFTLPIFFKSAKIDQQLNYLGINYYLKKEIYEASLIRYLTSIQTYFKKLYFINDPYHFKNAATTINEFILKIFEIYFPDEVKTLTKEYEPIKVQSLKIPDTINDEKSRKESTDLLGKELTKFGSKFKIPNNPLTGLSYQIYTFITRTVEFVQVPAEYRSNELKNVLNQILAYILCIIHQSTLNHHSLNKNYFIWSDFDYSKCHVFWNKRD